MGGAMPAVAYHYLCCDPLWTAVISNCFKRCRGLMVTSHEKLDSVMSQGNGCRFTDALACYHSIEMQYRSDILCACGSGSPFQAHNRINILLERIARRSLDSSVR